jgi:hypothetical protein
MGSVGGVEKTSWIRMLFLTIPMPSKAKLLAADAA